MAMAEPEPEWNLLFQKPRVHGSELEDLKIKSQSISHVPPPEFLGRERMVCVFFREYTYQGCTLSCYQKPSGFAAKLRLTEEFERIDRVQLKEGRQLSVFFRRVGDVLQLKLDQGVTPEIPLEHNTPWTFLASKELVSDQELSSAILCFSPHDIRPFYNNSPLNVKRLVRNEAWFNLEAYSPGEGDSFDSQMRVQQIGDGQSRRECTLLLDIRELTPGTINPWERVEAFYRYKRWKLEVGFVTPAYPDLVPSE